MLRGARQDSKMIEGEAGQQKHLKGPAWDTCLGRDSDTQEVASPT